MKTAALLLFLVLRLKNSMSQVTDNGNKVLAQLYDDNPNGHFNIIVNDAMSLQDMILSVKLKGVAGKHDQGGGFIWRFTDKNNYYVVRSSIPQGPGY